MKRILSSLLVMAAFVVSMPIAYAATATTGPVNVSATVEGALTMAVTMKKNDFNGATIPSMDFGTLVARNGTLDSSTTGSTGTGAVDVFITANSHGVPYTITQTGTQLSNGTATIPNGALNVVPTYSSADNSGAAIPAGAVLGTKGTWVANGKVLYQSESGSAQMRTIQAFYSITDDPNSGATSFVPLDQPTGSYSGTITFTVTA